MAPGRPVYRSGDGIHGPEIEDVILGLFKLHGSDRSLQVDNSTYGRMSTWTCNCSSSVYYSTLVPREPHGFSAADAFVTYKLKSPRGLADTWPSWSWKKEDSRKILALFERGLITGPTPYGSPRTHKPQQALLLRYFLSILALGSITQPNTFFRFRRDGLGLLLPGFRPPDGNVLEIPGLLEDRRSTSITPGHLEGGSASPLPLNGKKFRNEAQEPVNHRPLRAPLKMIPGSVPASPQGLSVHVSIENPHPTGNLFAKAHRFKFCSCSSPQWCQCNSKHKRPSLWHNCKVKPGGTIPPTRKLLKLLLDSEKPPPDRCPSLTGDPSRASTPQHMRSHDVKERLRKRLFSENGQNIRQG
ncbi:hypothetical protein M0657_002919 [Pyricularia oryzae]|nr:hypothetical protein M9X92_003744 [Pyricularia oryzae]KAI7928078.1 hypothetical protein M0657_002919 [Pyricularia oryzae]